MTKFNYDVLFIGSGHAAWHAALTLRQAGKSVAIVEEDLIAGTCTNYGCNAKILLDGPADIAHQAAAYRESGILTGELKINWEKLMAYKHQNIDPMHVGLAKAFENSGITLIDGHGQLQDAHTVKVDSDTYTADNIVLATGQRPAKLDIPGKAYLHDSRDFLSLPHLPNHITFIGAGIISLEFADLARQAGAAVTVIEFADQAIRGFYAKYSAKVVTQLKEQGVDFHFKEAVSAVAKQDQRFQVSTQSGLTVTTDYVIDATGRIPNTEQLGLDQAGIQTNRRGIIVDDHLRTTQPNIFASGDVIDKTIPKLTPTATFESNYIASQLIGLSQAPIQYPAIPSVVFTLPRIAQTGMSIAAAQKDTAHYQIQTIPYGQQMRFETKNESHAEMTIVTDQKHRLVGATIYGNDAQDLINTLTLIIDQQLTADQLDQMIFTFPGASAAILDLLRVAMRQGSQH